MGIQMQKDSSQILRHAKQTSVKITAASERIQAKKTLASDWKTKHTAKGDPVGCSRSQRSPKVSKNVSSKCSSTEARGASAAAIYNVVDDIISKSTPPPNVKPTVPKECSPQRTAASSKRGNLERFSEGKRPLDFSTQNVLKRKRITSPAHVPAVGAEHRTSPDTTARVKSPKRGTKLSTPRHQKAALGKRRQSCSARTDKKLAADATSRADKKRAVIAKSATAAVQRNPAPTNIAHVVPQMPVAVVENVTTPKRLAEVVEAVNEARKDQSQRHMCEPSTQNTEVKREPVATNEQPWNEDAEMEDLSEAITQSVNGQQPLADYNGIYLITDTNVFLQHLNLIKGIINADTGSDTYIVCVPWIVIQELDRIRNNKKESNKELAATAFQAILYINRLLETKNPKLRGQTIAEARIKDSMMPRDGHVTNDDHLLCCCLSLHRQGSRVILMTNDTNLRNKAIINGIESYGARIVEKNLKGILAKAPVDIEAENWPALEETLSIIKQGEQAVWEKVTQILQYCLSVALRAELKSALGDNRLEQVAIRPPWTALSALECALKHWQDCHLLPSSAFTSTIAPHVKTLAKMLKEQGNLFRQPKAGKLQELFDHSVKICSHLQLHYFLLAEEVATLRNLKDGWMQHIKATPAAAATLAVTADARDHNQDKLPTCVPQRPVRFVGANLQRPVPAVTTQPSPMQQSDEQARQCIQLLQDSWSLVNDFCGTVSKQACRCYEYPYQESPRYVSNVASLQTVYKHLYQTREHMERLLRRNSIDLMADVASLFLEALQALVNVLLEKLGREKIPFRVTSSQMAQFFQDSSRRDLLENGFKQIVTFQDALGYCLLATTEHDTSRKTSSASSSSSSSPPLWN
ncbi:uncharacterized protein LOC135368267 [Ornithodoros turicata]|uniref:uncharacterized protein LOC135368267 n=1 Tax=Ornithodoros turicata TaxID=34597 RepID=UPI003138B155